ncbi:MAG: iron ABC transporter permease [Bacillota bacterium]|nr:MAG: iron ABC transporter permease [Bacillota bacterium]
MALAVLGAGLVVAGGFGVTVGSVSLPPGEVLSILMSKLPWLTTDRLPSWPSSHEAIVLTLRLPRVLLAGVVGASLAVAGGAFQGLFRNPMADPYIIGVSSGAALGASLAIALGVPVTVTGLGGVPLAAFAGAVAAVLLVYAIARVGREVPVGNLLLSGVAVGAFLSALVSLVVVFSRNHIEEIVFWLMGSLAGRGWTHLGAAVPYLVVGSLILLYLARDLNALLLGEEEAAHLGIDVERTKKLILGAASLLTAAAVATCGVVGFVGLVVPHIVRLMVGPDHRSLLPVSAAAGALLMILADLAARTVIRPGELPIGVVTALLGGPFFLYLLRRSRSRVL